MTFVQVHRQLRARHRIHLVMGERGGSLRDIGKEVVLLEAERSRCGTEDDGHRILAQLSSLMTLSINIPFCVPEEPRKRP